MPLPDVPEIREALSLIDLSPSKPIGDTSAVQLPSRPAIDQAGQVYQEPPLWLSYSARARMPLNSLVARIGKDLEAAGHKGDDGFGLFVIGLAVLARSGDEDVLARLNRILRSVCDVNANLYYAVSIELPDFFKFEIPPFRLGPLRREKLRYNCDRASSDYYARYEDALDSMWAIEREPRNSRALDVPAVRGMIFGRPMDTASRAAWELTAWESIINGYFSLLNSALFEDFWREFSDVQTPLLALGAPLFDPRPMNPVVRNQQIAVFLNLGPDREGFVAPAGVGPEAMQLDLANAHIRIPNALKELKDLYGFQSFDASPLHQSIRIFAEFVGRARRHEIEGRVNEALLHFVIALELIFGDSQSIQRSVSERVAVATYRYSRKTFDQQRECIESIYELRSRYVHTGAEAANKIPLDQVRGVCEQVFRCLMRLQAANPARESRDEKALKGWLRELDYLAKGMIAGKQPTEAELREAWLE